MLAQPVFDDKKAEAFAGQMIGALNNSAAMLMTSIGHRTGLFDKLAEYGTMTAFELAIKAGLAERYVREWLAVLTTSRIIDYDPTRKTYTLPAEHATFLTRTGTQNLAVIPQFLGVTFAVEDDIIARFGDGHGLHYHHYDRFHEVMAEVTNGTVIVALIDHILPIAPGLIERLEGGIDVIDVGCGAGRALQVLAERFPKSRFTGVDLCADAYEATEKAMAAAGITNVKFKELDLSTVSTLGAFDLVTAFDAVHDQKDPQGLLDTVRNSLKPDGVFLMQDIGGSSYLERNFDHPMAPWLYMMSTMHCTPVSLGQGGAGLGTMWGVEMAAEMLAEAGFSKVSMTRLPHDIINAYFVARP
jgi:2-polyprenyl-3-methyl-5-hydroxy-6-metoxy-1,4-benzoquinol methylase